MNEPAMKHPQRQRSDHRAIWENQHDNSIKKEVEAELENWGKAYRDAGPHIGYPTQQPYYTPPRDQRDKPPPRQPPDTQQAQTTEDNFVMWRLILKESPDHIREHLERLHDLAVLRYVERRTMADVGKAIGVGRRHAYRLQDELLFRYWVMSL